MTVTDDVNLLCKLASFLVLLDYKTTGDWLNQKIRFENDFCFNFLDESLPSLRKRIYWVAGRGGDRQTVTERRTDRQKETGTICSVYRLAKSSHIIRGEGTEVEKKRPRKKKGQAEMPKAIASFFLYVNVHLQSTV